MMGCEFEMEGAILGLIGLVQGNKGDKAENIHLLADKPHLILL